MRVCTRRLWYGIASRSSRSIGGTARVSLPHVVQSIFFRKTSGLGTFGFSYLERMDYLIWIKWSICSKALSKSINLWNLSLDRRGMMRLTLRSSIVLVLRVSLPVNLVVSVRRGGRLE